MYSNMNRKFQRPLFAVSFLLFTTSLLGQHLPKDYFPRLYLGVRGGYYNSFIEGFDNENHKEPILGGKVGFELVDLSQTRALYGVFQYDFFVARLDGKDLIKWRQSYVNFGFRYTFLHTFWGRPTALFWVGAGASILGLKRKDFQITEQIIFDENNQSRKVTIDNSVIDRWSSKDFYVEIGQMIPFPETLFPKFGFMWGFKYDRGRDKDLNIGSISLTLGLYFSGIY
ncbi:hypothetical protein MJD09_02790 [bacterium]|nr:hypothetical protein [bacterium]